jgi:hypothetical protein
VIFEHPKLSVSPVPDSGTIKFADAGRIDLSWAMKAARL